MNTNPPSLNIDGVIIPVTPHPAHEYTMSTAEAAAGYGVGDSNIRECKRKHADELIEGKHFISVRNPDANPRAGVPHVSLHWTKLGIITLGFFIRSERAKRFRKMAADLVLREWDQPALPADTLAALADVGKALVMLSELAGRHTEALECVTQRTLDHEERLLALEAAARRPHYDEPVADATFDALVSAMRAPKRAPRQRHAVSLEERRILAAHRIAEALLAHRGKSFNVTFQEIVRIGRELGLDDFQFEEFSDRFPEKGTPSMQSSLGKLVNRLLNGQTFVVDGKEWSFVKSSKARGSVYRAIREN